MAHLTDERRREALNPGRLAETKRKHRIAHQERYRDLNLQRLYGITLRQYTDMLALQGGRCAICNTDDFGGKGKVPHVDHDHETGVVRGLLCHHCNTMLGLARNNPDTLLSAVKYLWR